MPRLVVTLGDPAGIGPEVTQAAARALLSERSGIDLHLVGAGAPELARALGITGEEPVPYRGPMGAPSAESGRAALGALERGMALVRGGRDIALVTAPISKQALALAGSHDRGHTEILARELGTGPVAMAFWADELKVVLATTHVPLRQAIASLSQERVIEVSLLFDAFLRRRLPAAPRLALCGLNPHAGEGGLLGDDEQRLLEPAVAELVRRGVGISGPHPADTVFHRARQGEFDGVVALYHDQGLIPVKLLSFGEAVNVTLGLCVPRTSPDHGTAYDIAGKGVARPGGMLAALRLAAELAKS